MPVKKPPRPPGVDIDLDDKDVQKAASMIQKSFRGHRVRAKLKEDGPPRILQELKDVKFVEGSAVKLVLRLGGFPYPTVTWFKDGQPLKEGPKYQILFENDDFCSLVIRNTDPNTVGNYTCNAHNQFGDAFDSSNVTIDIPAKIEKGPPNQSVKCGTTIKLEAKMSGDPEPDVGWAKDGEDIEETDRVYYDIEGDMTVLTIKNCTKKDSGKYEIYVENDFGTDHSAARIDVK